MYSVRTILTNFFYVYNFIPYNIVIHLCVNMFHLSGPESGPDQILVGLTVLKNPVPKSGSDPLMNPVSDPRTESGRDSRPEVLRRKIIEKFKFKSYKISVNYPSKTIISCLSQQQQDLFQLFQIKYNKQIRKDLQWQKIFV